MEKGLIQKNNNTYYYGLRAIILCLFIFLYAIFILQKPESNGLDLANILLFVISFFLSSIMLMRSVVQHPYSLTTMHWFFCMFFYGVAGFLQYLSKDIIYGLSIGDGIMTQVILVIIIWQLFFLFGSRNKKSIRVFKNNIFKRIANIKMRGSYGFILFATLISFVITCVLIIKGGFGFAFSRSAGSAVFGQGSQAMTTLYTSVTQNMVVYGLALSIVYYRKNRRGIILILIQIACCLIVNSPIGMPRYNVAIVYIGLFLLMFPKMKTSLKFIIVFFIGFIVVFPLVNVFRYTAINEISSGTINAIISNLPNEFLKGDYDSFAMIINTMLHTKEYGISGGLQLLGVLLFFIPRSIWPGKPFGSGYTVRLAQGEQFKNVSSPLIAEGLINFGLVGVMVFGFLAGKIVSRVDNMYWRQVKEGDGDPTYLYVLYPFLLSMFFFINRGDMMSTVSYAVGHIAIFSFMFWLSNLKIFSKIKKFN